MIPSFLLAKLYVKGSLKNTETGFEFSLKNIIDSTMLIGIGPVTVGERDYAAGCGIASCQNHPRVQSLHSPSGRCRWGVFVVSWGWMTVVKSPRSQLLCLLAISERGVAERLYENISIRRRFDSGWGGSLAARPGGRNLRHRWCSCARGVGFGVHRNLAEKVACGAPDLFGFDAISDGATREPVCRQQRRYRSALMCQSPLGIQLDHDRISHIAGPNPRFRGNPGA